MRRLFGPVFVFTGILHFVKPRVYEAIMPDWLPAHRELVYASGVAEIAAGAALLHPRTRKLGGRSASRRSSRSSPPTCTWRSTPSATARSPAAGRRCWRGCRSSSG